ncbi:DNA-binding response regulator [Ktedonobacteria bacterium brp13]|nr:DNA-binding response regulator [Ktedonobacteria bacterium brp13]
MSLKVLIAEAQEVLRIGLRSILTSDTRVSEVHDVRDERNLHLYLANNKPDLVIVNQNLLADISILQTKNFVILAVEPNITTLKAAYEYGARGYLSVNVSAELLRTLLRPSKDAFLVEPTLVPAVMEFVFDKQIPAVPNETLLTPREKEIVRLLRKGYDRSSIARQLCITETTLKTHMKNIAKKRSTALFSKT